MKRCRAPGKCELVNGIVVSLVIPTLCYLCIAYFVHYFIVVFLLTQPNFKGTSKMILKNHCNVNDLVNQFLIKKFAIEIQ